MSVWWCYTIRFRSLVQHCYSYQNLTVAILSNRFIKLSILFTLSFSLASASRICISFDQINTISLIWSSQNVKKTVREKIAFQSTFETILILEILILEITINFWARTCIIWAIWARTCIIICCRVKRQRSRISTNRARWIKREVDQWVCKTTISKLSEQ
jgi:hypothetical protein